MIGWLVIQTSFHVNDYNSLGAEPHTHNTHMPTSQRKKFKKPGTWPMHAQFNKYE